MSSLTFRFTRRGLIAAAGLPSAPPPSAQYRFDNDCGTSACDSSGNVKTASLTGGAGWTTGHASGTDNLGVKGAYISGTARFAITTQVARISSLTLRPGRPGHHQN